MSLRVLDESKLDGHPTRAVCHWSAGGYDYTSADEEHYHFAIDGDLVIHWGQYRISDNDDTSSEYAAHTKGMNTKSVGAAFCAMAGAVDTDPLTPGPYPVTECQWNLMVKAFADLVDHYGIAVDQIFQHGECPDQDQKWDVTRLTWRPDLSKAEVCDLFRQQVMDEVQRGVQPEYPPCNLAVEGNVVSTEGRLVDGVAWGPLRPLCDALVYSIMDATTPQATVFDENGREFTCAFYNLGGVGYVPIAAFCVAAGLPGPGWDEATKTVWVETCDLETIDELDPPPPPTCLTPAQQEALRQLLDVFGSWPR